MVRNRFRSQPSLQRSSGGVPWGSISVSLAVLATAAALGAYSLAHFRDREPANVAEVRADAPSNVDQALAEVANPPVVSVPAFAPAVEAVPAAQVAAETQRPPPKRVAKRKPGADAAPAQAVDDVAVAAAARERQQKDYEAAVARYDTAERAEGYRWAQANRVRAARYCKTTARRTEAFMEGCLSYLASPAARSDAPVSRMSASPTASIDPDAS